MHTGGWIYVYIDKTIVGCGKADTIETDLISRMQREKKETSCKELTIEYVYYTDRIESRR
jgi:hypothetical protein